MIEEPANTTHLLLLWRLWWTIKSYSIDWFVLCHHTVPVLLYGEGSYECALLGEEYKDMMRE